MKEINITDMQHTTRSNIDKAKWGSINGQEIWLFTLKNKKGSVLTLTNYGAIVQSLKISDKRWQLKDILLGYGNLNDYIEDQYYMGAVIGRCASRIAGGKVIIDNHTFTLPVNEGGYHHHGGKIGFNKKIWQVVEEGESNIRLHYRSQDGEEGYPGNLDVMVNYCLDDDNNWSVEYMANTDKSTIINLTQHSYFNLDGHDAGSVMEHEIRINAEKYLPVNAMQVPKGEIDTVRATPFDFLERRTIGLRINEFNQQLQLSGGYDHSWVLEEAFTGSMKHAANIRALKTGIELNVYTTEPAIHLYTGNFLENINGKNNVVYNKRSGFCLETQHFPDTPNHSTFPSIVLEPGKTFSSKTIFQFSNL